MEDIIVKKHSNQQLKNEYDSPWKNILDIYFKEFILYCWPKRYLEIDWTRGYKSLDKELHKISKRGSVGNRIADKLFEVYLKSGQATHLLVHLEIQGTYKISFEERMFISRYRIKDLYQKPVASIAILIDKNKNWRPNIYREELWDSYVEMKFPIIKILDYREEKFALESSSNPFATVILAQLSVLEREEPNEKLISKVSLIRWLYQRNWKKEDVLNLLRFIDWIFALPPELEVKYMEAIDLMEEELKVNYVTSWERRGQEQGIQQGVQIGESNFLLQQLERKFKNIPEDYRIKVKQSDNETLLNWAMRISECETIEEVFKE